MYVLQHQFLGTATFKVLRILSSSVQLLYLINNSSVTTYELTSKLYAVICRATFWTMYMYEHLLSWTSRVFPLSKLFTIVCRPDNTSRRQWRWFPQCPSEFPHKQVSFTKEKMPWCPCLLKTKHTGMYMYPFKNLLKQNQLISKFLLILQPKAHMTNCTANTNTPTTGATAHRGFTTTHQHSSVIVGRLAIRHPRNLPSCC